MRGRPKLDDKRDNQYRVRLNNEENDMLNYVSEKVGKMKSDIFRIALKEYYNKVRLNELNLTVDEEIAWDLGTISLKRIVKCPFCNQQMRVDIEDECNTSIDERDMGPETIYEFDYETECLFCDNPFRVYGYISEYPSGALNYEKINVSKIQSGR